MKVIKLLPWFIGKRGRYGLRARVLSAPYCEGKVVIGTKDVINIILRLYNSWERCGVESSDFTELVILNSLTEDESNESHRVAVLTRHFDCIITIRTEIF